MRKASKRLKNYVSKALYAHAGQISFCRGKKAILKIHSFFFSGHCRTLKDTKPLNTFEKNTLFTSEGQAYGEVWQQEVGP
jgi:hypothetical protein